MNDDITIRFPLTKGDGFRPGKSDFSEKELSDIRSCLAMGICWEPDQMEENQDAKIISLEFLYDGITNIKNEDFGYWFEEDGGLYGYPAPIVRFKLDHMVDEEQFLTSIFTSSFRVITASMEEDGEDPYYAEDQNGYTSVLSEDERLEWIEKLKNNNALCSKIFNFPDGLPESGYSISATDFVMERGKSKD